MKIDVVKVAKLANLPLSKKEEAKYSDQLSETLTFIDQLNEIDTKNIEPTHSVTGLQNVMRDDETEPSLSQEQALSNTKSIKNNQFKVKAIFDES